MANTERFKNIVTDKDIPRRKEEREYYPLTEAQKGIYIECMEDPDSKAYNIPHCCKLSKDIDMEKFLLAVKKVFKAHKALTVGIGMREGEPVMLPSKYEIDIPHISTASLKDTLADFIRPFRIEKEPLCRAEIVEDKDNTYLVFDTHHIITDGTSLKVLMEGIVDAYKGEEPKEEELDIFDISIYEKELKQNDTYAQARKYFADILENTDTDSRPVYDVTDPHAERSSATLRLPLNETVSLQEVDNFLKENDIKKNALFLTAFAYTLAKFNGDSQALFTTVSHGRHDKRLQNSVGMFVKTLPMYFNIQEDADIVETLGKTYQYFKDTVSHDIISFGELANRYGVNTAVTYIYQGEILNGIESDECKIDVEILDSGDFSSEMDVMVIKKQAGYELELHYRQDLYTEGLMRNFGRMYANVLKGILTKKTFKDIVLTDAESLKTLEDLNRTESPYDDTKTVIDLFREQVTTHPENTAVVYKDTEYTYKELNELTDILAQNLKKEGMGREKVTAVLIPRCEYMVTASLGVLKSGGAYLPLDPTYPPERLELMVKDSGAEILITTKELDSLIKDFSGKRIYTEEIPQMQATGEKLEDPKPKDLFILLYTSGSTGVPKGVMLEHGNVFAYFRWYIKKFNVNASSHATSYASYGFDACMQDLYPALMSGGCVYIIPEEMRLELKSLHEYFEEKKITHSFMTTQIGRQFALMGGLQDIKSLMMGGEKLVPFSPPNYTVVNAYGPTECSMGSSMYKMEKLEKDVPIGRPVDNLKFFVMDSTGRLLPPGATGELLISGKQVARGYLNRPEQTAKAFTENPFSSDKNYSRVYHTGDMVRFMPTGDLQFIGRRDAQVKIRGFRIELTEVEEVISRFEGVEDVAVAAFDDPAGGKYIVAYIVSERDIDIDALNRFILAEKPPYMVPAVTMRIEKIPYNQNQKVNKRALPLPERKKEEHIPVQNDTQKKIFDSIAQIIGHNEFGINTNIYQAGLTSIGAVKLNVILSENFDMAFKTADLKENDTVEKLEKFINSREKEESFKIFSDYALTKTQEGIFVDSLAKPNSTVYNVPTLLEIDKEIDTEKLKQAIVSTVNAHPYIKTTLFLNKEGEVKQRRQDDDIFDESFVETIHCEDIENIKSELVEPFELIGERLFKFKIIEGAKKYLYMDMHHIITDGTSVGILLEDITKAYMGIALEKEKYSSFELVLEENKARQTKSYQKAQNYYADLLADVEGDALPYGDITKKMQETASFTEFKDTTASLKDIKAFCQDKKLGLNAFFTCVFGFVLSKYNFTENTVFSGIYNGRNDSRFIRSVGMFVKTLPIVSDISGENKTVRDHIAEMGSQLIESQANDIYSFSEISRNLSLNGDVLFAFEGGDFEFDSLCGKPANLIYLRNDALKAPLCVFLFLREGKTYWACEYDGGRYSEEFIHIFLSALDKVCCEFLQKEKLRDISLLSPEAEKINTLFKNNDRDYDTEKTVVDLFRQQAAAHPENTAVVYNDIQLTYRELDVLTDILAQNLRSEGIEKEKVTAILIPRCEYMVIASLGVLKAGGAYMPLDPSYPSERLEVMLKDSGAKVLITTEELNKRISPEFKFKRIMLSEIPEMKDMGIKLPAPKQEDLFILLYTSGSTGVPKGVMLVHRNLTAYCAWHKNYYRTSEKSRTAAYASYGFDACMNDIYPALTSGGSIYIIPEDIRLDFTQLHNYFEEKGITNSFMTTQIGRQFSLLPQIKSLEFLTVGGEKLTPVQPPHGYTLCNGYGPTECTVFSTMYRLPRLEKDVPIGRPLDNMHMYIVDKYAHPLPPGAVGELLISGPQVARGYLNKPNETAAVFTKNIFEDSEKYNTLYHTGDIVNLSTDGNIHFIGRRDAQVKIRGFRVELTEVEEIISRFEGIKDATVIALDDNVGGKYLAAYLVSDTKVDVEKLKNFILEEKPPYMVPSAIVRLDKIPYNQNQKVNKKALPIPERKAVTGKEPQNETEKLLCGIFAQTLGLEKVFADNDFFELGGTSIIATKLVMKCVAENINVVYKDIFDHPTPQSLAEFLNRVQEKKEEKVHITATEEKEALYDVLKHNVSEEADDISYSPINKALVTGVTGFLGAHVVKQLIDNGAEKIYCLARGDETGSAEERMKVVFMYYFDDTYGDLFGNRIIPIEGDITDASSLEQLKEADFDILINCAACVKHFSNSDILERVNFHGVENLIDICTRANKKLIQVSTLSVAGETDSPENLLFKENQLEIGQIRENKYVSTKWQAENAILTAVKEGKLKAKIVRVGNLMGRNEDGEFQANFSTNGFMNRLKAYSLIGCFPIGELDREVEFSAIDYTAKAITLLAGTPDKFTVFHANNCHKVHMANVLKALDRVGVKIDILSDRDFDIQFKKALSDEDRNIAVSALTTYNSHTSNRHFTETDNKFTVKALYRLSFMWPIVDEEYIAKVAKALLTLEYFDE